ncbi:hypothetical protein Tco_1344755 [Tanacetum coccineum]
MRTRSSLEYTIPRRRNRRRSRHQMADDRPMAEQLQASTGGFESAIVVPLINTQNFELKSSLINLVQNRIFRGGNDEEPHAHIRHFESITNNQRYPDVPNTTIKLLILTGLPKYYQSSERNYEFSSNCSRIFLRSLGAFQGTSKEVSSSRVFTHAPIRHIQIIENKAKVRCSRNAVMRVSTNAPPSYSTSSSSNFEFQQMAAALEDKMTLTFRKYDESSCAYSRFPIKAVEERCTTCGSNHSFNVCPMNRGSYDYPVYHDNFQKFQQAAAVGNFVQGNSGYPPSSVASYTRPPGFTQPNPQASRPNQGYNNQSS